MLKEAKKAMRVTVSLYDSEIASLLMAGANDLQIAGVKIPGTVTFTVGDDDQVTDESTLTDTLVQRAIITYALARFGNPPNYAQLKAAYDEQKAQLAHNKAYTDYSMTGSGNGSDSAGTGGGTQGGDGT